MPAELPPDLAFGRSIALIRAHLATGDELVAQRDWRDALPHVNFPREEIYGVIREDLRRYKTPHFDGSLKTLTRAVQALNLKQYQGARASVERALTAADTELKTRQPDWPRFLVQVAIEALKTAQEEYEAAIVKGSIAQPVGYQTARGFILQAERMLEAVAGDLQARSPQGLADMRKGFAQIKQAFPSANAPKSPPIATPALQDLVSGIGQAAKAI